MAAACSMAALDVMVDEKLAERSAELGEKFRSKLRQLAKSSDGWITEVRGMGLFNAIVIDESKSIKGRGAWHLYALPFSRPSESQTSNRCLLMKERGLLAKPTHVNTIRLAPPLVITEEQVDFAVETIKASLADLDTRETILDLSAHHIEDKFTSL
jgi:ornithine--oxo-acid transaminase